MAAFCAAIVVFLSLVGCSSSSDGAVAAAKRYVELIATADGEAEFEELWAMSMTSDPHARIVGEFVASASERIEVLEVTDPQETSMSGSGLSGDALDTANVTEVSVSYRLDSEDYESTIVLAPVKGEPVDDIASWRVVEPLVSVVSNPTVPNAPIAVDVFLGEVQVTEDNAYTSDEFTLFPGVYDYQLRSDPYLTSTTEPLTVIAGVSTELPELEMQVTEATQTYFQQQSDENFAACAADVDSCPDDISEYFEAFDMAEETWQAELITPPTISVTGANVELAAGQMSVVGPSGPTLISFSGSGVWYMDNQSNTPYLDWIDDLDLVIVE